MRTTVLILLTALLTTCTVTSTPELVLREETTVATFSIVAFDPETGDLGVAVQSKFFGVGSVVPWARAGVGAIATQAFANTTYGPEGLDLLASGLAPEEVVKKLTSADEGRDRRQLGIVDHRGSAAAYTGKKAIDWAGHVTGEGFACQGNILAGENVVMEMADAYRRSVGALPERLVAALLAGQAEGGDRRGRQSAALLVVRRAGGYAGFNDRYVDIRVEDNERPIDELARLLALHRKFYPNVPVPRSEEKFEVEPLPSEETLTTPRGAWEAWKKRFAARDFKAMYALYTKSYRATLPPEDFVANMERSAENIASFLETATYAGTSRAGEQATVALKIPGSPRPMTVVLVLEEGAWRFAD
jgi:uncharacterized Ntn-hydrolase superfamily protein